MLLHHFYKKKEKVIEATEVPKNIELSDSEKINSLNDKITMLESRVTTLNKVIALSLDSIDNEMLKLRNRITHLEVQKELEYKILLKKQNSSEFNSE